jgi:tRNA-dihydrouridine synthase B
MNSKLNHFLDKKLEIQGVKSTYPLILAPMSGVTNPPFRRLIRRRNPGALGLVVTEFISIEGLTRNSRKSLEMMKFHEEESPISIQIFGYDIERMVDAAKMVEDTGADIVDINSGCPVPKVVRRGGGCELMRQPAHMGKMLEAVAKSVKIPLTLKIRSGWDDNSRNAVEIAKMAENCGVKMLTVHGRTRVQLYRDYADYEIVQQVCQSVKIPVIGSGDVVDAESSLVRFESGVSGLMIGRAALENPWVFSEIKNGEKVKRSVKEIVGVITEYLDLMKIDLPDKAILGKLKQFSSQVTRQIWGSAEVRKELCRSQTLEQFLEILNGWEDRKVFDVSEEEESMDISNNAYSAEA